MNREQALEDLRQPLADMQDAFVEALSCVAVVRSDHFDGPLDPSLFSHLVRGKVRDAMVSLGYRMSEVSNTGLQLVGDGYRMKVLKIDARGLNRKALSPRRRAYCSTSEMLPPADGGDPDGFWDFLTSSEADGATHYILEWKQGEQGLEFYLSETQGVDQATRAINVKWRSKVEDIYLEDRVFVPEEEDLALFVADTDEGAVSCCGW